MSARIVLLGATGATGARTAEVLVGRGARPLLAGRDPGRLAALAARLGGLETAVADVTVPGSVRALLGAGDVLVTTVGQFLSLGAAAVEAAVDAGAVYLDCAPEPPFVRRVFEEFGPRARSTALLPAFGHDYVAGTLAAATALAEAGPDAHSVRVGYALLTSAAQGSSRATLAATEGVLRPPGFAFTRGRLKRQAPSGRDWRFTAGGRERRGLSVGGAEHLTLPALAPGLQEVGVYLDWVWQLNPLATLMGSMSPALGARLTPAESRDAGTVTVAEVRGRDRRLLARAEFAGPEAAEFTAGILAWGAIRAAEAGVARTGALGPVPAFGLLDLTAGAAAAGLSRA